MSFGSGHITEMLNRNKQHAALKATGKSDLRILYFIVKMMI